MRPLLDRGYTIAATDYAGMGTDGPDSYLVGDTGGNAVLDSRAPRSISSRRTPRTRLSCGDTRRGAAVLFRRSARRSTHPSWTSRRSPSRHRPRSSRPCSATTSTTSRESRSGRTRSPRTRRSTPIAARRSRASSPRDAGEAHREGERAVPAVEHRPAARDRPAPRRRLRHRRFRWRGAVGDAVRRELRGAARRSRLPCSWRRARTTSSSYRARPSSSSRTRSPAAWTSISTSSAAPITARSRTSPSRRSSRFDAHGV